jgi:hypothetical protein
MARIDLKSSAAPKIRIGEVAGSLQIKAWDEDNIRIEIEEQDELDYSFQGDTLKLSADTDCYLRVPSGSSLEITEVGGNADVVALEGSIKITEISGNLNMKNVGPVTLEEVSGNFYVRGVEGDLNITEVSGNATLRDVEGNVNAKEIGSNLNLRDCEGNVTIETGGNAELHLELHPGGSYKVEAGGNLFCHIDPPGDAQVHLASESERMHIYTETEKQTRNVEEYEFKLGSGAADMQLSASGTIDFRCRESSDEISFGVDLDFVDDIAGLAEEISDQVSSQVETQIEALNEQLTALGNRLRESGGRQAHVVQRRVEQAQRRLERKLHRKGGRVVVTAAAKPVEPVSAEERALILQMVQEKKINVAEAEMLLNTLEGRKPAAETKTAAEPAASSTESKQGEGNA